MTPSPFWWLPSLWSTWDSWPPGCTLAHPLSPNCPQGLFVATAHDESAFRILAPDLLFSCLPRLVSLVSEILREILKEQMVVTDPRWWEDKA